MVMVGFGIDGREKSAAVWEPVCERRAGKCESETVKREVNQEGWSGRRRGTQRYRGRRGWGVGAQGRNGGEERDERGGVAAARRARARDAVGGEEEGESWGSMDATPRGTTLSWILRSKPATA